MSEEGMIPNDASNELEADLTAPVEEAGQEGGEQTPVAETPSNEGEAPAVTGVMENEALPAAMESETEPDEAEEDLFPTAHTEVAVEENETTEAEQDALRDNTGDSAQTLLNEIMGDHTNFDSIVEKANPTELVLLMDTIANRGKVSEFAKKVLAIKKSFDEKVDPATAEANIISRFQTAFAIFNKKRTAFYAEMEKEKEENSQKKKQLLEQLKQIVADEQVTKLPEVREIQTKWREIGWVAQKDVQPLNETYRQYLDIFYNLRSQHQHLLDYDRKLNLEEKRKIAEEIENLIPTEEGLSREEWTARSAKVKNLQEHWRTVGLVPKENLDEINVAYRNAIERFYELRTSYFELQDQQKTENAEAKKALLEKLKPFLSYTANKATGWNEATRKVLALQEEWKKIGPGPLEENKQLWKEYRNLCDTFFNNKGQYFKSFDDQRAENLRQKLEICEKAEAMQDSTDWKEGVRILKELQEQWKNTGPVHERNSNKIWKRFRKACDTFFERRSAATNSEQSKLEENLKLKEALIERLQALVGENNPSSETYNEIQTEWKATGHVPFKVKDKINSTYKELVNKYFAKSRNSSRSYDNRPQRQIDAEVNALPQGDERTRRLHGEIKKLKIRVQEIEGKVSQYELNIQYISKGKSGDSLRAQIQGQIDAEKAKIKDLRAKMKEYQKLIDNPPAANEPDVVIPDTDAPASENSESAEA